MTERLKGLVVESRQSLMAVQSGSSSLCSLLRGVEECKVSGEGAEGEIVEAVRELEALVGELNRQVAGIKTT